MNMLEAESNRPCDPTLDREEARGAWIQRQFWGFQALSPRLSPQTVQCWNLSRKSSINLKNKISCLNFSSFKQIQAQRVLICLNSASYYEEKSHTCFFLFTLNVKTLALKRRTIMQSRHESKNLNLTVGTK